jgi:hypothetical protein
VGRVSIDLDGEAARRRVLQFRTGGAGPLDTTLYQRRAFVNRLTGMVAALADPERYLRLGSMVQLRREEFVLYRGNDSARGWDWEAVHPRTIADQRFGAGLLQRREGGRRAGLVDEGASAAAVSEVDRSDDGWSAA